MLYEVITLGGCERIVDVELKPGPVRLVVEGRIERVKEGLSGMEEISAMMAKIRSKPPEHIGGHNVEATMDVQSGTVTHGAGGEVEKIDLPKSNRITSYNVCYTKLLR